MTPSRVVVVLLALAALAVVAWGAGWGREPGPGVPMAAEPTTAADAAVAPAVATVADAAVPVAAEGANARIAVAGGGATASEAALVGRIVDDKGQAVVGAEVACSPAAWIGGGSEDSFDAFDRDTMRQRARTAAAQRTTTVTDAEGRFQASLLGAAKTVHLRILARGFVVLERQEPRPQAVVDLGDLVLERGAIVAGTVVDHRGQPVAQVRVGRTNVGNDGPFGEAFAFAFDFGEDVDELTESARSGTETRSDAEGRFELAHLRVGEFVLQARHAAHPLARTEPMTARAGALLPDVQIRLQVGAAITGKVLGVPADVNGLRVLAREQKAGGNDAATGFAAMLMGDNGDLMADAGMSFGERSDRPGADGAFTLQGLQVGRSYRVWAVQEGRGLGPSSPCSSRVECVAGSSGIELRFDTGVTATCTVVDARTGAPVEALFVSDRLTGGGGFADMIAFAPSKAGRKVRHCPGGFVAVTNLRPKAKQTLTLAIDALGYGQWQREGIVLPPAGALDLGTIRLEPVPQLRVEVVAAATGRPVAGAKVWIQPVLADGATSDPEAMIAAARGGVGDATRTATTDVAGRCSLNAIVGAKVRLRASANDYAAFYGDTMLLPPAGDSEQVLRLQQGGCVEVTVVDADGKPFKASVRHQRPEGEREQMGFEWGNGDQRDADANGFLRFEHLSPGTHGFALGGKTDGFTITFGGAGTDASDPFTSVDVVDGQTATVRLQAEPHARVHGVVRENGLALAGARVTFVEGVAGDQDASAGIAQMVMQGAMSQFGGSEASGTTRADDDGAYELVAVESGAHRLSVMHKDRAMPTLVSVQLRDGDNIVDIDLEAAVLRGVVRDAAGQPIAKAKVRVQRAPKAVPAASAADDGPDLDAMAEMFGQAMGGDGSDGGVSTGADGSFELRGVEPDTALVVLVRAKGFAPAKSAVVRVGRGAQQGGIVVELGMGGAIKVTMADAPPFSSVRARCLSEPQHQPVVQMLRGTSCTLDGLPPGRWEVTLVVASFGSSDGEPRTRTVEVAAGATANVDF